METSLLPTSDLIADARRQADLACHSGNQALHQVLGLLIGRLERQEAELAVARTDPVTALPTRSQWTAQAQDAIASEAGGHIVVIVDLDDFKPVNDRFGHQAGDYVLAEVGERLTRIAGAGRAARIGGDEFALLMACRGRGLDAIAAALTARLAQPIDWQGRSLAVGASVGAAVVRGCSAQALSAAMSIADKRMYAAKGHGRRGRGAALTEHPARKGGSPLRPWHTGRRARARTLRAANRAVSP
ncbi:GGDEF domain-containing protein [Kitasatospora sp. NPDC088783]|uniref:GGDEF domain-containing protein n=1 Tax=Kitasatospora sp. NPDC088783 TaxID=3364077 RepID=UPI00381715D8